MKNFSTLNKHISTYIGPQFVRVTYLSNILRIYFDVAMWPHMWSFTALDHVWSCDHTCDHLPAWIFGFQDVFVLCLLFFLFHVHFPLFAFSLWFLAFFHHWCSVHKFEWHHSCMRSTLSLVMLSGSCCYRSVNTDERLSIVMLSGSCCYRSVNTDERLFYSHAEWILLLSLCEDRRKTF